MKSKLQILQTKLKIEFIKRIYANLSFGKFLAWKLRTYDFRLYFDLVLNFQLKYYK